MEKSKEPVRLRRRRTPSGRTSLYLDIYVNGERTYEYLRLYLVPEVTRADREANRETVKLAEAVRAKRIVEVRNGQYGFEREFASETRFFDYYLAMCEKRRGGRKRTANGSNWGNWYSALHHLRIYEKRKNITFADITPEWVQGFKDYLEHRAVAWAHDARHRVEHYPLRRNSKMSYFNKLRACLNQAYEERIIATNPMRGIEGFKYEEGTRMYLTVEELRRLVAVPCEYESVRRAFLFSCLTGLRRSDILRLTWGEVFQQGEFTRIIFKQKKTNGLEYLDLAPQAVELMGERGRAEDFVFDDIFTPDCTNNTLERWCLRAGIDKHITFHCGRHTFAVMMLDIGTDIYTVSKLLGHRQLSTTQIYARVLDKNKQAAVQRIPDILPPSEQEEETEEHEE